MNKLWTGVAVLFGALAAAMSLNAEMMFRKTDAEGHVLTKQWQAFHKAANADKPKEMAKILEEIKAEASRKRYCEDFYDAGREWVYAIQRRNWKESESARATFAREVAAFDEPIVTLAWMEEFDRAGSATRFNYVKKRSKDLKAGHHPHFYKDLSYMDGNLAGFLRDDEEYALWKVLEGRSYSGLTPEKDEVYAALAAREKDVYPAGAYLEFVAANRVSGDKRRPALEAVAKKYAGKAVSFYPRQAILRDRFSALRSTRREKEATEADYKALYADCQAFEKERKAFKGDEKKIADACSGAADIAGELTHKSVGFSSKDRRIDVIFKNIPKADVQFYRARAEEENVLLWTRRVENEKNRFFLEDTVSFDLPAMDDGEYVLKTSWAKEQESRYAFSQFRVSLATRTESEGLAAYAADYMTGEPVKEAEVLLLKGGKEQFRERIAFAGFTRLPARFLSELKKGDNREIACEYRDEEGFLRRSRPVSLWSTEAAYRNNAASNSTRCNIYLDRGAYNPGNTLQYKAVVYKGNLFDDNHTLPAGRKLTAKLFDSESNELATEALVTGEFGSAAGSFVLPTGLRNGFFSLQISLDGAKSPLTSKSFRVDEFVLPTFDVSFERREGLFFPGDEIPVSGTVKSYSGHSLSGAKLLLDVRRWGNQVVSDEEVAIAEDGSFRTKFVARYSGFYNITVKVTDGTGETLEFSDYVFVIDALNLSVEPVGAAEGEVEVLTRADGKRRAGRYGSSQPRIITTPDATYSFRVYNSDRKAVPGVTVSYSLLDEKGKTLETGDVLSGEQKTFRLPASGLYKIKAAVRLKNTSGDEIKAEREESFVRVLPEDTALHARAWKFFQIKGSDIADGEPFGLRFGAGDGPVWAVVTLYENGGKILDTRQVQLKGGRGKAGSLMDLDYTWQAGWPEAVRMNVFFFRDGREESYDHEFRHKSTRMDLPLRFTALTDKCFPGTEYTISLQTEPDVEAVAAIYDKSLDAIASNDWPLVALRSYSAAAMTMRTVCGDVGGYGIWREMYDEGPALLGAGAVMRKTATRSMAQMNVAMAPMAVEESAALTDGAAPVEYAAAEFSDELDLVAEAAVREHFEEALTFQPFLRSDASGELSFTFRTSDKLSTYYVAVYAHDKNMRNASVREELVVSIPVKVAVNAPRYLYRGDALQLAANVSSNSDKPVSGTLYLYVYDSADHAGRKAVSTQRIPLTVPARGSLAKTFAVRIPKADTLGLKTVFVAKDFLDAVFQAVPVRERNQSLTEAHSAVLLSGMDEEAMTEELRSRFVNVSGKKAEKSVITVLDMVRDAIPGHIEPSGNDVVALSEAYYTRLLSARLRERYPALGAAEGSGADATPGADAAPAAALLDKILACRNADGGFGWFEGMRSSPMITAVILDRFAKLAERGFPVPDLKSSVKWLDANQFSQELPYWCGWVSDAQYMHIRARYASVPFEVRQTGDKKAFEKRMADFKKYAQDYLAPSEEDGRGLTGQILFKARRIATLRSLLGSDEGKALAKAWGIRFGTESKLRKSMDADFASLLDYAVEHRDGGWYYPNAVMPFRGLLESEAYAHALLTDLLTAYAPTVAQAGTVADGLRIWLMLQKETQKWDEDAAYVDAITSILDGSEAVLATKVLVLKADATLPFETVKAAGNGFTVERRFFREKKVTRRDEYRTTDETRTVGELEEIRPGTPLAVGDKIVIRYSVWSQENRSFVRLSAPREASLMPAQQLSGHYGWGFRPLRLASLGWSLTPQGYRNVKADRTEYYFDSFPEEKTDISETFFVTQAGTFTAPVVTVESLYAPHYRANAAFPGVLTTR